MTVDDIVDILVLNAMSPPGSLWMRKAAEEIQEKFADLEDRLVELQSKLSEYEDPFE